MSDTHASETERQLRALISAWGSGDTRITCGFGARLWLRWGWWCVQGLEVVCRNRRPPKLKPYAVGPHALGRNSLTLYAGVPLSLLAQVIDGLGGIKSITHQ